jgi:hypothetical protein
MKMIGKEEWRDKQRASEGLPRQQQMAAGARERGEHDMAVHSRVRVTVDLRGIGSAVKAEAAARNLSLAAFARAWFSAHLQVRAGRVSA